MKSFKEYFKSLEEKAKKMNDKEFDRFYKKLLKKYGVKDLEDLSKEDKKKFFNDIEKNVQADDE